MTQVVDRQRWLSGLPTSSHRPWWQRMLRSPLFWITLVLVPFFVYNLVDQYQMLSPDRTYPDGTVALGLNNESLRMAAYWAMWTALVYTILFIWLDRFRPQKPLIWFLSFGWGACTATWASIYINSWAGQMMQTTSADADSGTRPAIFIAPFVEEATKATVLFLLVVFYRNRFISRINVVSLAGLSAIGFAFVENIIYYARVIVYANNHIEVGDPEQAVLSLVMLRGVYTSFGHPIFTMMTAFGIAVALGARSKWVRVTAPLAGFLVAAGGHMLFNGVSSLNPVDNLKNQWYMALGFVVVMVLFLVASVVGETRVLRHRFIDLRQGGWLNDQDVIVYSSPFRRIKLHLAGICRGPKMWWRTAKFMRLITELAHTREQTIRGTVGPGSDHRTHELVHQIEKLRPDALTDTQGLTIIPRRRPRNGVTPYPPLPYPPSS